MSLKRPSSRTIFDYLCRNYPERFHESQVRTLQRRIKLWRGAKGANREVFFPQRHVTGRAGLLRSARRALLNPRVILPYNACQIRLTRRLAVAVQEHPIGRGF